MRTYIVRRAIHFFPYQVDDYYSKIFNTKSEKLPFDSSQGDHDESATRVHHFFSFKESIFLLPFLMICVKSGKKYDFLNTDIYMHRLICKKKIHLVLSDSIALFRFPML